MDQKHLAIHQFTPSITLGDGVSNALFFTQKILITMGFESKIYAVHKDKSFAKSVERIDDYPPNKQHLLLYHHSIGHKYHEFIMGFADKKILVYHNITPSHFFPSSPHLVAACNLGRAQLASNPQSFIAAYADSPYNAKELISLGYKNVATIPLLLDIEKNKNFSFDEEIVKKYQETYNIITVGRIVSNKAQHEVINTLFYLKKHYGLKNIKLFLVGGVSEPDYDAYLRELRENLLLEDVVILSGKVSDEELQGYYRCADLFLTLSNHEGFCIPLLEAMLEDIPTLAFDTGGISATLPASSLLHFKSPDYVASKILEIKNSAHLRHEMVKAQKEHLEQFSNENIIALFKDFLSSFIEQEIPHQTPQQSEKKSAYRIEGPFDSSYSLSIVNQNIALALANQNSVSLYSTEGYGDFKPNEEYLHRHPEIDTLYKTKQDSVDNTIRNLYPPRANAMLGAHKIIGPYGWEESEFLPQFVEQFNSRLTMLFCMSDYVKDVMTNNGVKIPALTVGIGADHVLKTPSKPFDFELPKGKKLLHISSCFPRKGADVLLDVFCALIKEQPELTLIVKTFPNPHNNIIELIEKSNFKKTKILEDGVFLYEQNGSSLLLINKDLEQSHINYLYENADVFVAPTRGEGFGLPQAEAMLFSLPVVTTAYCGQSDFCTPKSAWLVDFEFDYAKTHMNLPHSLWVEPSKQSLLEQLKIVLSASKDELNSKLLVAKEHILSNYTWQHVAQRIKNGIASYDAMKKAKPKVGIISTFNTKCGIAEYTRYLISTFENSSLKIFAPSNDLSTREDDSYVMRCWQSGENDAQDLTLLKDNITKEQISSLIIQYNFSFFSLSLLEELLLFCKTNNIKSYLFIHSAKDVPTTQGTNSFAKIASTLQNTTRIMLHSLDDINLLKKYGIYKNTILFAHGYDASLLSQELPKSPIAKKFNISKPLVGSFGFLLPHKGILELIKAAETLHHEGVHIQLLLLNSIHPAPVSGHEKNSIDAYLSTSPIKESVFMYNDFLEDKEILSLLRECRMVVYPYQNTQESSSAAARFGLLSLRPVLTTPLAIFDDIRHVSFQTKGMTPNEIAKSIEEILLARHDDSAQREWIFKNDWQNISQRFYNTIEALQ